MVVMVATQLLEHWLPQLAVVVEQDKQMVFQAAAVVVEV
jgi:hypothetical protein